MTGKTTTLTLSVNMAEFRAAMDRVREALENMSYSILGERYPVKRHAFTPDFDLRCTFPRCNLRTEEHR